MARYLINLACSVLITISLYGQETPLPFQSKMADLGEIQLEYMDFGGEGIPFIWVQDFHNYFEGAYKDTTYYPFFANLSKHVQVYAPLRRGYGKSTNTEWGYDVATQSEDLIAFMDAIGIDKAVLFGRLPANQEMTYIAEHHPDRLAGLIYWGDPILIVGCSYADERLLMENWGSMAPDFDKEKEKIVVMSRAFWRPHFLGDKSTKINIPAIRIINSELDKGSVLRRLVESGRIEKLANSEYPGYEEEIGIIRGMVEDSGRFSKLRKHLIECDPSNALSGGMERTFGNNLQTIDEQELHIIDDDFEAYLNWLLEPIKSFIEGIKK